MEENRPPRSAWILGFVILCGLIVSVTAIRRLYNDSHLAARWAMLGLALLPAGLLAAAAIRFGLEWKRGRRAPFTGRKSRALFYSLTLALAAQFAVMQPYRNSLAVFSFLIAFGLFAAALLWAGRLSARLPRLARSADLVLMNLCLIAWGGEIALRVLARVRPSPILYQADATAKNKVDEYRLRPGELHFGFPANRGGHYDTEFVPRDRVVTKFLVVSIGDSFSASFVPHGYHFTTVCEREFPEATVYNMGVVGVAPREYAYLLQNEAMPLRPDLIVVNLYVGNDLVWKARQTGDFWFDRENLLLYQVPRRLLKVRALPEGDPSVSGKTERILTPDEVRARFPWVDDPMREDEVLPDETHMAVVCRSAGQVLGRDLGTFERCLRYVEEMRVAAGATPILFVLIPVTFQVEEEEWPKVKGRLGLSDADRDSPQRLLVDWFRARGIPCLDLLPRLRAVAPLADGQRHVYHRGDMHFNSRGNRVAGEALAEALRGLLK